MKKILRFVVVGFTLTAIDFLTYQLVINVIFGGNNDWLGVAAIISGIVATIAAYLLHKNITWQAKKTSSLTIIKFFLWNALLVAVVRPILTWAFGALVGLYQFAFMISGWLRLPFSYEFVESTGVYVLMIAVAMILNFLVYDRYVFSEKTK